MTPGFYDLTVLFSVLFVLLVVGLLWAWLDIATAYSVSRILRCRAMALRASRREYSITWELYHITTPTMADLENFTNTKTTGGFVDR